MEYSILRISGLKTLVKEPVLQMFLIARPHNQIKVQYDLY